jgi:hypothetical protein
MNPTDDHRTGHDTGRPDSTPADTAPAATGLSAGGDLRIDHSAVALHHSTATLGAPAPVPADLDELRATARRLTEQLRQHQPRLEDGADLVDAARRVEAELVQDRPRRVTLLRWLGFIAPGVQTAATLATDVAAIQDAVTSLL